MKPQLPLQLRELVDAARKVARLHVELRQAVRDEASERILAMKGKARNAALDAMVDKVLAFEQLLGEQKLIAQKNKPTFDWHGFFRTTQGLVDVIRSARDGNPATPKKAKDWIEGEIL